MSQEWKEAIPLLGPRKVLLHDFQQLHGPPPSSYTPGATILKPQKVKPRVTFSTPMSRLQATHAMISANNRDANNRDGATSATSANREAMPSRAQTNPATISANNRDGATIPANHTQPMTSRAHATHAMRSANNRDTNNNGAMISANRTEPMTSRVQATPAKINNRDETTMPIGDDDTTRTEPMASPHQSAMEEKPQQTSNPEARASDCTMTDTLVFKPSSKSSRLPMSMAPKNVPSFGFGSLAKKPPSGVSQHLPTSRKTSTTIVGPPATHGHFARLLLRRFSGGRPLETSHDTEPEQQQLSHDVEGLHRPQHSTPSARDTILPPPLERPQLYISEETPPQAPLPQQPPPTTPTIDEPPTPDAPSPASSGAQLSVNDNLDRVGSVNLATFLEAKRPGEAKECVMMMPFEMGESFAAGCVLC